MYWPDYRLTAEIQGGEYKNGRHNRGDGMNDDYEKAALLKLQGIDTLFFTGIQVRSGFAARVLEGLLMRASAPYAPRTCGERG